MAIIGTDIDYAVGDCWRRVHGIVRGVHPTHFATASVQGIDVIQPGADIQYAVNRQRRGMKAGRQGCRGRGTDCIIFICGACRETPAKFTRFNIDGVEKPVAGAKVDYVGGHRRQGRHPAPIDGIAPNSCTAFGIQSE